MLSVTAMSGFGATVVIAPVTLTFVASTLATANATAYTFSSHSISTAAAGRQIVVSANGNGTTGAARSLSSLVVAGVSAAEVATEVGSGAAAHSTAMWVATVPTGTSGDIVVTWNAAMQRCGIGVWAIYDAAVGATDTVENNDAPPAAALTIPAKGAAIGAAGGENSSTFTWTNLTENFDEAIEADKMHTGASTTSAAGATPTITCQDTATSSGYSSMVLGAWGPA